MSHTHRIDFRTIAFLLICSILFCLPLFRPTLQVGQDLEFHLARITSLANVFQSPVNFHSFAGHGNMISTYYPWLTVYPIFLIIRVLGNILLGYRLAIILLTFLTGLAAYSCAKYLHVPSNNSLLFAITYLFSTYHAVNLFLRSAVGEIICAAIIPIVFTALYATLKGNKRGWVVLAISMSAIVYTHVISVLLTAIVCLLIALARVRVLVEHKERFFYLLKSAVLAFLLSAGFLIPFTRSISQRAVQLPTPTKLQAGAVSFPSFINSVLTSRLTSFTLGILIIVMLLFCLAKFRRLGDSSKFLVLLSLCMVLLQIHSPILSLLDLLNLNQIQFIWRLNAFSTLFISYVFWSDAIATSNEQIVSFHTPLTLGLVFLELLLTFMSTNYLFNVDTRYFIHGQVTSSQQMEAKLAKYAHGDYRPVGSPSPFDKSQRGRLTTSSSSSDTQIHTARHDSFVSYHVAGVKPSITFNSGIYYYRSMHITHNSETTVFKRHGLLFAHTSSKRLSLRVSIPYPSLTRFTWLLSFIVFLITMLGLLMPPKAPKHFSFKQPAISSGQEPAHP